MTKEAWNFTEEGQRQFFELHCAESKSSESEGFVVKEILRTGEWPVVPTKAGLLKKPLRIQRDGISDASKGTISLEELVSNFKAGAVPSVQIPLSDDNEDHKNITKLNTGFVRDLWIEDEGDVSKLVAKMDLTEPDVKEKVLRGTYSDVSSGIPWNFQSRGKQWNAALEHVCITNRPFIDGLGPFLAASDQVEAESAQITHFNISDAVIEAETPPPPPEQPPPAPEPLPPVENPPPPPAAPTPSAEEEPEETPLVTYERQRALAEDSLRNQLDLMNYKVIDVDGNQIKIKSNFADVMWTADWKVKDGKFLLSPAKEWQVVVETEAEEEGDQEPVEIDIPRSETPLSELEEAQRLREIRFSGRTKSSTNKEGNMPLTREEIEKLELSDDARAALTDILDENASLRANSRESEVERRIGELQELGFAERPGALKLYRQVMLADDGGPAVVLLSDGGQKERKTALDLLNEFIEAIKGSDEKVHLSDQALVSPNDEKPPVDTGDERPLEERIAEAKQALGQTA